MTIEVIRSKGTPTSHLPFSPAIKAGDFVFVSGQASVDETGKIVNDTFEGEFRRSLENTRKILDAAGLTFANVVQVRSYIDNPADLAEYNKLYRDYFKEPFPARTTIVNCLGGALKYEVDVTAYAGK
ncbi:MAG: reactive intermediate/imine deaminase [Planctomycetaceae bacterium]|nr:RidA family protein [Gemmataceae bacterium]PHX64535.1 MAG: reactive intermediate/imine deaminase [Planctomycetaceae bacterium]